MTPYYEHAGITIFHGDCREILPGLPKCDLLLTDPPYGIGADTHEGPLSSGWTQWNSSGWDKQPPDAGLLSLCIESTSKAVIWGGNYFDLMPSMGWFVWNKGQRDFSLADGELAWTSENRALRIFDFARAQALQDGRQHPTQKPLALMKWCTSHFPKAETIKRLSQEVFTFTEATA